MPEPEPPRDTTPGPSLPNTAAEEWARYWTTHHGHVGRSSRRLRKIEFDANFARWLAPARGRVLEIGFGNGESLQRFAALGYADLHGWDISEECVARARAERMPGTLRHCDAVAELAREAPEQFDVILAKDLLEHLPREAVTPFTQGVYRALRPGGVFLARLPNMANPFATYLRYDDFTHQLGFTENSLRQVFMLGGFERELVFVEADRLPGLQLLRAGLVGHFLREACLAPAVRWAMNQALASLRKGPARVSSLRLILAAQKRRTGA